MYIPPHFQEQREEVLLGLIAKNPLSAIVWQSPDGTVADHIPLSFKKSETGKVVPTWNYVAVHVYGKIRAIEDANWILQQITTLTSLQEQSQTKPWKVTDAPSDYIERMISAIVGIEIEITKIIGKSKMSQNQVIHNQQSVGAALNNLGSEMAKSVADLVLNNKHI